MSKDLHRTTRSLLVDFSQNMSGYLVDVTTVHTEMVLRNIMEWVTR